MIVSDDANQTLNIHQSSQGRRIALVIGVNHAPKSGLPKLQYAESDAQLIATQLTSGSCQFELYTSPLIGSTATSPEIKKSLIQLIQTLGENDLLLFYFSGHGRQVKIEADRIDVFLVTSDYNEEDIKIDENIYFSLRWLQDKVLCHTRVAHILVLLDCCYPAIGAVAPDPYFEELKTRLEFYLHVKPSKNISTAAETRWSITASSPTEEAHERDGHGIFSSSLIKALNGEAVDNKGYVTIDTLYPYIHDHIASIQTPGRYGYGHHRQQIWIAYHPQLSFEVFEANRNKEREEELGEIVKRTILATDATTVDLDYFDQRATKKRPFDHSICRGATLDDISTTSLEDFLTKDRILQYMAKYPEESRISYETKLVRNSYITYGALLCFGVAPQNHLIGAKTHCIVWDSNDQNTIYDRQDIDGSLIFQYEQSLQFIRKHLKLHRLRSLPNESDQWEIPFVVLREAVANALIHRQYPERNDGIYIEIFNNRIEITNPGLLPQGTTPETFIESAAQGLYSNPLIAEIFYFSGYVEQAGSGLRRIKYELESAGLQPPEFLEFADTSKFKVVLYRPDPKSLVDSGSLTQQLKSRHNSFLDMLRHDDIITGTVENGWIANPIGRTILYYSFLLTKENGVVDLEILGNYSNSQDDTLKRTIQNFIRSGVFEEQLGNKVILSNAAYSKLQSIFNKDYGTNDPTNLMFSGIDIHNLSRQSNSSASWTNMFQREISNLFIKVKNIKIDRLEQGDRLVIININRADDIRSYQVAFHFYKSRIKQPSKTVREVASFRSNINNDYDYLDIIAAPSYKENISGFLGRNQKVIDPINLEKLLFFLKGKRRSLDYWDYMMMYLISNQDSFGGVIFSDELIRFAEHQLTERPPG